MNSDELKAYAQENGERFWRDAGNHFLNDRFGLMADARVIEVGGYLGNWTDYIASKYECYVDVYEPVKQYADHMDKRFSNRRKITVHDYGVESYTGNSHIAIMDEGSSLYNGGVQTGPVIQVMDASTLPPADLLALNCEGSEYRILDRLIETGTIVGMKQLIVQFHAFYPDAWNRRAAIREKLAKTHWETLYYPFCWEGWRLHGTRD